MGEIVSLMNRRQASTIIATLPCGAFAANSSSYQCVMSAMDEEQTLIQPNADEFVRVMAYRRVCNDGPYYLVDEQWYTEGSVKVQKPSQGPEQRTDKDEKVFVAIAFTPTENMDGISEAILRFDEFPHGATALNGSCLTSIAPNINLPGA